MNETPRFCLSIAVQVLSKPHRLLPPSFSLLQFQQVRWRWRRSWLWTCWRRPSRTSGPWWMWPGPGWPPDPMLPTLSQQKLVAAGGVRWQWPNEYERTVWVTEWNMRVIVANINLHSEHPPYHHNQSLFSPNLYHIDASLIRCNFHNVSETLSSKSLTSPSQRWG